MSRVLRIVAAIATTIESQTGFEWFAAGSGLVMVSLVLLRWAL